MEDKHLYRETQWDVSAEESRAHHGLVAIGFAVLAVLVIAFCIWTFGGRGGAAWEFEADDSLAIMAVMPIRSPFRAIIGTRAMSLCSCS